MTVLVMTRLTRDQSRALTREKLLHSAGVVFSREGYAGASIDRIAEEAGFSKGAFYSNYASKEAIFLELVEAHCLQSEQELQACLSKVEDADSIIQAMCDWAVNLSHEPDVRLLLLELTRHARANARLSKNYTKMFHKQWTVVGTLLLRIFPAGQAPIPALSLGALVMELAYGNAVHFHTEPSAADLIGIALRALRDSVS